MNTRLLRSRTLGLPCALKAPANCTIARFWHQRRAATAVEFALSALALFLFLFGIVNLGLLGFSLSALARGVQTTARSAAVYTSAQYTTSNTFITPSCATIVGYFNSAVGGPLPTANTSAGSNPLLTVNWTNNSTGSTANYPPGLVLALTGHYNWAPIGFAGFFAGIPLSITTVVTVMGTASSSPKITITAASCP
ncbi:MAG: TadE/TadG family type IV pilus assembly protein [Acidocella sp.]|nr:TadE/TadG family type IV pilus assembly protein [Acidocella sp.]